MRAVIKKYQRLRINRQIDANRRAIQQHRHTDPENFLGREHLYMRDHALREQREAV